AGPGRTRRVPGPQVAATGGRGRGGHRAHGGEEPVRVGAPHPRGAPAGRHRHPRGRPPARRGRQELAARGAMVSGRTALSERGGDCLSGGGWGGQGRLVEVGGGNEVRTTSFLVDTPPPDS